MYMGGKVRLAKHIREVILSYVPEGERVAYWEPFVGGAAVLERIAGDFQWCYASDVHEDLILMWQAVQAGWLPPSEVSEEEWRRLKFAEPSALRGAVGFGCSFGGRWFEGFARCGGRGDDFAGALHRALMKSISRIQNVTFQQVSYIDAKPTRDLVIYCDPPYQSAKRFSGTNAFNSAEFWQRAREWSEAGCKVFVSEYTAPEGWVSVWSRETQISLKTEGDAVATERLFVHQ